MIEPRDWVNRYEIQRSFNMEYLCTDLERIHREQEKDRNYRDFRVISVVKESDVLVTALYTYQAYVYI